MRNENLELAQSSGSDSSPSWAAVTATPKASTFSFEFGSSSSSQQNQGTTAHTTTAVADKAITENAVDELTSTFKVNLNGFGKTDLMTAMLRYFEWLFLNLKTFFCRVP